MVDLDWKTKMVVSPPPNKLHVSIPATAPFKHITNVSPVSASESACSLYEQYLRLPELKRLWSTQDFPGWHNEAVLKPALHALEITFRFVSAVLSDPRPYANRSVQTRRLESLATSQIELISQLIEDEEANPETRGVAPVVDLSSSKGVVLLTREGSYAEVWKAPGGSETTIVNKTSEASLLPRLATWQKSEDIAQKILFSVECEMRRCPYTLGLGEPNLAGKPNLDYDTVCKPNEVHSLKKSPQDSQLNNQENQRVYATHQILECWIQAGKQILSRLVDGINKNHLQEAYNDCYLLEKIWKLLTDVEDLLLLTDPDDFLKLKAQLLMRPPSSEAVPFCFRSKALVELTKSCKELRHKVPEILGVEVDPKGGPRVQEAAMRLYREGKSRESEKVHLLQALQGVEKAMKGFYYSYKQVLVVVMGSLEAKGNTVTGDTGDTLGQLFLEPTYFPSLDAAKTFIGEFWSNECGGTTSGVEERRTTR